MNYHSPGVLNQSKIFLYNAGTRARSLFYYLLCIGHYSCTSEYLVARQRYNSFLLLYTLQGEGYVLSGGEYLSVKPGCIAFIDCYQAHTYKAGENGWEMLWMHIDGADIRNWYSHLSRSGEPIVFFLPSPFVIERTIWQLYESFVKKDPVNEARMSQMISNILTELYIARFANEPKTEVDVLDEVLTYISTHIEQPISVQELAERAHLSPFHFSRVFKQNTGFPPYEYILARRIENAKYLLVTTDFSIKKVAVCCGFRSASSFCTHFKKRVGVSPLVYRRSDQVNG